MHGVPVEQTAAATDPVSPVSAGHLPTLLASSHIPQRASETPQKLAAEIQGRAPVVVVDAANETQLRLLARAVALLGADAISVGSAGLARHLATVWATSAPARPVLVVVTSQHDVARRQAAAVIAAGGLHLQPASGDLIHDEAWALWSMKASDEIERPEERAEMAVLSAPPERDSALASSRITERLGDMVARLCERGAVSGVLVTGGDGARALVDALRATGIALEGEVVTGVPIGTLVGGKAPGMRIVTKAGAFGDDDTLLLAADVVRARARATI